MRMGAIRIFRERYDARRLLREVAEEVRTANSLEYEAPRLASVSEIFARVVQLELRGYIVGDRSAGMVMQSRFYGHEFTTDAQVLYGASITRADLVMTDGKSLEHAGVDPDVAILPTSKDIATKRDLAMAKAATLVGGHLTPEEAGTVFPPEDPNQE